MMKPVLPRWLAFLVCWGWLLAWTNPVAARAATVSEAQVKAVLLFRLSQFVNWPPAAEAQPFCIGILGPDDLGPALDQAVQGESVRGRTLTVKRAAHAAELADCQIVFVSPGVRETLSHIRGELSGMPSLLVGESDDFLSDGGMVRLALMADRKIRLEIQLDRVRASGLNVSAQLLRVSIVKGNPS
jgi:hypothetical protein